MPTTTDLIRSMRATGMSQTEIARRTGIPQPRISRWEAGGAPESADDALRLKALHDEIVGPEVVEAISTEGPPEMRAARAVQVAAEGLRDAA
jgi:transcriptional regulator with XRE-family HTH domain